MVVVENVAERRNLTSRKQSARSDRPFFFFLIPILIRNANANIFYGQGNGDRMKASIQKEQDVVDDCNISFGVQISLISFSLSRTTDARDVTKTKLPT